LDSPEFAQLSCEIATVEYAQALLYERIAAEGEYYQAAEGLREFRETVDRVTRAFAAAA